MSTLSPSLRIACLRIASLRFRCIPFRAGLNAPYTAFQRMTGASGKFAVSVSPRARIDHSTHKS